MANGVTCWRCRRWVKRWFRESKYTLHIRYVKLDFGAAFDAELEHAFGVLLVVFATGLPNARYAESTWPRIMGLLALVVCLPICICVCSCSCPCSCLLIPCSFTFPPLLLLLLLHTDVAAVVAERSEAVSLSYWLLAELLYTDSGAGLVTSALKDTSEATNSNAGKKVSPEGIGGTIFRGGGAVYSTSLQPFVASTVSPHLVRRRADSQWYGLRKEVRPRLYSW